MISGTKVFENIKRLAYAQGKSLNQLCQEANVSRGTIGDLEHGRRERIGVVTLYKLCKVLECQPDDILSEKEFDEPMPDKPKVKRDRITPLADKTMQALVERPEFRRLIRAALKANDLQVKSTAILLESIVDAQKDSEWYGEED